MKGLVLTFLTFLTFLSFAECTDFLSDGVGEVEFEVKIINKQQDAVSNSKITFEENGRLIATSSSNKDGKVNISLDLPMFQSHKSCDDESISSETYGFNVSPKYVITIMHSDYKSKTVKLSSLVTKSTYSSEIPLQKLEVILEPQPNKPIK